MAARVALRRVADICRLGYSLLLPDGLVWRLVGACLHVLRAISI